MKENVILDLTARIYDSVLDSALWPDFLEAFGDAVGAGPVSLVTHDMTAMCAVSAIAVRSDPHLHQLYISHYGNCDPWRAAWLERFSQVAPDGVVTSEEVIAPAKLKKTEFYNDFLVPNDIVHQFCGPIVMNGNRCSVSTCLRSATKGPFGNDAVMLLQVLLPHLQKALQLHEMVASAQAQRDASLETIDLLNTGVILVDRYAHVLFANRAARQIVDQKDGLAINLSGVAAARPDETTAIRKAIYDSWITASGRWLPTSRSMIAVSRPSGRRRFLLLVVPLRVNGAATHILAGNALPVAAMLVSDPEAETTADARAFRQCFGLTSAESSLASILMKGKRLEEATDQLGISMNTAKTQLKAIFAKTGTSKQGELIRVLLLTAANILQSS